MRMDPLPAVEAAEARSALAADEHAEQEGAILRGHQRCDVPVADAGHLPTALHLAQLFAQNFGAVSTRKRV